MNYVNPHAPSCPWYDITEAHGAPNIKWCEETLCQWISEPANTWSNLGYICAGLFMFYWSLKNKHDFKLKQYGPIIFLMGAGSFYYHQSNFYTSQILDFVGMFFFVGWCIGVNLIRLGKMKESSLIGFNLALGSVLTGIMHLMYLKGIHFQILIILMAFVIIATEVLARGEKSLKWFVAAIVTLACAFSFSFADKQKIWCHPENHGWFSQGHAVWHWLGSVGMVLVYLHYIQPALNKETKS